MDLILPSTGNAVLSQMKPQKFINYVYQIFDCTRDTSYFSSASDISREDNKIPENGEGKV